MKQVFYLAFSQKFRKEFISLLRMRNKRTKTISRNKPLISNNLTISNAREIGLTCPNLKLEFKPNMDKIEIKREHLNKKISSCSNVVSFGISTEICF